jgi:hypothetical protein
MLVNDIEIRRQLARERAAELAREYRRDEPPPAQGAHVGEYDDGAVAGVAPVNAPAYRAR